MSEEAEKIVQNYSFWTRCAIVVQVCFKEALLNLIHNADIGCLPKQPENVHSLLLDFKRRYKVKLISIIKDYQWQCLCHLCDDNCEQPCSKSSRTLTAELDITCLGIIVKNLKNIFVNNNDVGFRTKNLKPYLSLVNDCLNLRNSIMHVGAIETISTKESVESILGNVKRILIGLNYDNMNLFDGFVALPLDSSQSHDLLDMETVYNQVMHLERQVGQNITDLENFMCDILNANVEIERRLTDVEKKQAKQHEYLQKFKEKDGKKEDEEQLLTVLSKQLKDDMKQKYQRVQIPLIPSPTSLHVGKDELHRDDIIVNLSLLTSGAEMTFTLQTTSSNRIQDIREKQRKLSLNEIEYRNIVSSYKDYVIIAGGPGCGKTTLVETLVYKWSVDCLWKDGIKFDFVFIIYLREVGKFRQYPQLTAEKLITMFYPDIDLKRLQSSKGIRSLLILEGFDELFGKECLRCDDSTFNCYTQAIYDLLNPNNPLLPFTRIITTRPTSCPILYETILSQPRIQTTRLLEITGFSESNIDIYVQKHFHPNGEQILKRIKFLPIIYEMMVIPFYCWGICYLLKNDVSLDEPGKTYTALFSVLLTLFIRRHGVRNQKVKVKDLIEDPMFKDTCLGLAHLAFQLEENGKISFTEDDLPKDIDLTKLIGQSGMIMEIEINSGLGEEPTRFQFVHYSFHEFLVAVYMFTNGVTKISSKNPHVISMLAGLLGGSLSNTRSPPVVRKFAGLFPQDKRITLDEVLLGINKRGENGVTFSFKELCTVCYEYQNPVRTDMAFILIDDCFMPAVSYDRKCQTFFYEECKKKEMAFGNIRFVSRFARDEFYLTLMSVCKSSGEIKFVPRSRQQQTLQKDIICSTDGNSPSDVSSN